MVRVPIFARKSKKLAFGGHLDPTYARRKAA